MPTAQAASVQLIVRQLAGVEQLCSLSRVPTQQTVSGLNKCNKMNISNLTMLCNIQRGLRNNLKTSPYTKTDHFFKKKKNWAGGWVGGFVIERGSGIPEQWFSALDFPVSAFAVGRRNTNIVNWINRFFSKSPQRLNEGLCVTKTTNEIVDDIPCL